MGELIRNLGDRFPGIADQLIENGDIRPSVAVSIDGEMVTGGVLDNVGLDSEIHFIPALGGATKSDLRTIRLLAGVCPPFPGWLWAGQSNLFGPNHLFRTPL